MKGKFGIISLNFYGNFTNYGSMLQSWALLKAIKKLNESYNCVLVNYCPDFLKDMDPLNPLKKLRFPDSRSIENCKKSHDDIVINYEKFLSFFYEKCNISKEKYTSSNIERMVDEGITKFIVGSDTVFCIEECGYDRGFFADYECMHQRTISYAASFADTDLNELDDDQIERLFTNFKFITLREERLIEYVKKHTNVPVKRVIDPTLLLDLADYDEITSPRLVTKPYLLIYSRRYNEEIYSLANNLASKNGWEIVEISLNKDNSQHHKMFYSAGIEEFLSLVKYSEYVVTNSYHGMVFAIQNCKPITVFTRTWCDSKISELLSWIGHKNVDVSTHITIEDSEYPLLQKMITMRRKESLTILDEELKLLEKDEEK